MAQYVPRNMEWTDRALQVRQFVFDYWAEAGRGPNLRQVHEGTQLERRDIVQAYKELQTGIVMVIYLEEAVRRKIAATGKLTIEALHEAVMDGALLRLRPKVMTVATVVAGLLPIMWSTRTGAEVMKPLATPVLGGMVSSLIHVLIVTPVIFTTIREREMRRHD